MRTPSESLIDELRFTAIHAEAVSALDDLHVHLTTFQAVTRNKAALKRIAEMTECRDADDHSGEVGEA